MSAAPDPANSPDRSAPNAEELKILGICAIVSAILLIAPGEAVSASAAGVLGIGLLYAHVRAQRKEVLRSAPPPPPVPLEPPAKPLG